MDLALTPDIYSPGVNECGDYIDCIPTIHNGIYCPCGARKDKIYETKHKFSLHIKTKHHVTWLKSLNTNKMNYFVETLKHIETIEAQRKLINQLEDTIKKHKVTIEYLAGELAETNKPVVTTDLLALD